MNKSASNIYISYVLQSAASREYIKLHTIGQAVKGINIRDVRRIRIPHPIPEEQQAIAVALRDTDALIDSLERLLVKKRRLKQGAMQELLTPKKGWVKNTLGSLGVFLKGRGISKAQSLSGDIPCVRYGEIYTKHNDCIRRYYSWISPAVATTATCLRKGDLLFAGSGETKAEIGKCVAFLDEIEAYAGGDIVILRPYETSSAFMGYYLNSHAIVKQKASKGQGDAVVHITSTALSGIDLVIPERLEEQASIAGILSDMDAEIEALEAKLSKYRAVKTGMMQELLTGRIRLI